MTTRGCAGASAGELDALIAARRRAASERLSAIETDLAAVRAARADAAGADDEHDPEGATTTGEWSRLAGLRRDARAELDRLDRASARLAEGTYGRCVVCGAAIPVDRLRALPETDVCVACAARAR